VKIQTQVLSLMPFRGGLATAGKQSSIGEDQLWVAENAMPGLDGIISSRPGLVQHGQTLTSPSSSASNSFQDLFADVNSWVTTESTTDAVLTPGLGVLAVTPSTGTVYLSRRANDTSSGGNYSLKFSLRLMNPDGTDTTGGAFRIRVSGDGGTSFHEYAITAGGVYVLESAADVLKYTPTYGLDLGGYHNFEIYYSMTDDETTLWVDGEAQTPFSMAAADDVVGSLAASTNTLEMYWTSGTDSWASYLVDLQFCDLVYTTSDPPFVAERLVDGIQYLRPRTAGATAQRILLVATDSYLYADFDELGAWRPIRSIQPGHTYMLGYRGKLVIFDDDGSKKSQVLSWDGAGTVQAVSDAPPVRFGAEYKTRLFAAGDRQFPRRIYYTGSRQLNVWFAPEYDSDETFDEIINAGYLEPPCRSDDTVLSVYADFFGTLIARTEHGTYQLLGSSPSSFRFETISQDVGGGSPESIAQVGGELFMIGPSGISTVQTAQLYGDLQPAMASGSIADKFSSVPGIPNRIDRSQVEHAYCKYLPSLNILVAGMRGQGSTVLDQTMVYAPHLKNWLGPWDIGPTFFNLVEIGIPRTQALMHGDEDGRVTFTGLGQTTDLGDPIPLRLVSAMISGRSVSPEMATATKTWRTLRVYILPRVNKNFSVRWKADGDQWLPSDGPKTYNQNQAGKAYLNKGFRLNIDRISSDENVVCITVPLNARGRYLQFEITSDYPFVYQGAELEFTFDRKEAE